MTSMKQLIFFFTVVIAGGLVFSSCATTPSSGSGGEAFSEFQSKRYRVLREADSLAGVKIPILRSPTYREKWGEPKIAISSAGDYSLTYADPDQPFQRLVIHGSVNPYPELAKAPEMSGEIMADGELTGVEFPQQFRSVEIAGKTVKWFQQALSGGADGAYYSTEGFSLRDGSGAIGHYNLIVESGNGAGPEVARRFASARLEK